MITNAATWIVIISTAFISWRTYGYISNLKLRARVKATTTKRTPVHQKWEKNVRHSGGAFIPCTWKIECNEEYIGVVERRLSLVVSEMGEEGADMVVEVRWVRGSLFFVQLPICSLHNCCEKLQSFKAKPVFTGLGAANLCATISASQ